MVLSPVTLHKALANIGAALLLLSTSQQAAASYPSDSSLGEFLPKKAAFGTEPTFPSDSSTSDALPLSLTPNVPCATLDYGFEVAGQPEFRVQSLSGAFAEVEVKYSEAFMSLSNALSDGPFVWTAAIANSNRVQTFNFTSAASTVTSMTQGGQRWQTLCLLRGEGVTFDHVAFHATVPVVENLSTDLAGSFVSSDEKLNAIWTLGPRATTVACIGAESQPPIWSCEAEKGTLVPGTRPGFSYKTSELSNYVLDFDTYLVRGGMRVTLGYDIASNGDGFQLHLSSEYPSDNTFSNANTTLFPPSTLKIAYGNDFVSITTVTSYLLKSYDVPFAVHENEWYHVTVDVDSDAHRLAYWLNDTLVFNASVDDFPNAAFISDASVMGAIGFGGWQDQVAYVRNVVATDRANGSVLYSNAMTDESVVLPEFGEQSNAYGVCMDGGKRDRYLWLGDFYHTVRILGVAQGVGDRDVVTGTWRYLFDYQSSTGQFPGLLPISYEAPLPTPEVFITTVFPDYAVLGLVSFVSYMEYSGNTAFASEHWDALSRAVDWLDTYKTDSGLLDFSANFVLFIGAAAGVAVNSAAVQAYRGMARVADAVGDSASASNWTVLANELADAINSQLWNAELGVFADAVATPEQFSVSGVAFAITSGVANESQALSSLALVDATLRDPAGVGYLDSSATDNSTKISPNTNGFLLDALLQYKQTAPAQYLLKNLWGAMLNDTHGSRGSWEYVNQDGSPGLSDFTSLSHPWGGAATYALTNFVAGIRAEEFGFATWRIEPLVSGFGLTSVKSHVQTPYGPLGVEWELHGDVLNVTVASPAGTSGIFSVDQPTANATFSVEITGGGNTTFSVSL